MLYTFLCLKVVLCLGYPMLALGSAFKHLLMRFFKILKISEVLCFFAELGHWYAA